MTLRISDVNVLIVIPPMTRLNMKPLNTAKYFFLLRIIDGLTNNINNESVDEDKIGLLVVSSNSYMGIGGISDDLLNCIILIASLCKL